MAENLQSIEDDALNKANHNKDKSREKNVNFQNKDEFREKGANSVSSENKKNDDTHHSNIGKTKQLIKVIKRQTASKYKSSKRHFDETLNEEDSDSFITTDEDEYENRVILKAIRFLPKVNNWDLSSSNGLNKFNLPSSSGISFKFSEPKMGEGNICSDNILKLDDKNGEKCNSLMIEGVNCRLSSFHGINKFNSPSSSGTSFKFSKPKMGEESIYLNNTFKSDEKNGIKCNSLFIEGVNCGLSSFNGFNKFNFPCSGKISFEFSESKMGEENIYSDNIFKSHDKSGVKCNRLMTEGVNCGLSSFNSLNKFGPPSRNGISFKFSEPNMSEENFYSDNIFKSHDKSGVKCNWLMTKGVNCGLSSFDSLNKFNPPSRNGISFKFSEPKMSEEKFYSDDTIKTDDKNEIKCSSFMFEEGKNCVLNSIANVNNGSDIYAREKWKQTFGIEHNEKIYDKSNGKNSFSEKLVFSKENILSRNSYDKNISHHSLDSECSLKKENEREYRAHFILNKTADSPVNFGSRRTLNCESSISSSCATDFTEKSGAELQHIFSHIENAPISEGIVQIPSEFNSTQEIYSPGLNFSKPFPHPLSFLPYPFRFHISYFFHSENK